MNERGSNHQLLKQNNHNLIKRFIYRNSPRAVVLEGRILSSPKNQERMLRTVEQYMFHIHSGITDFTFLPYDPDWGARAAAAVVVKEFLSRSL